MKTQLPPELVEKYENLGVMKFDGKFVTDLSSECAQVAVDYSQPFKDELLKWVGLHEEKDQYAKLIEKQRDELLEMLKYISSELESGDTPHLYKIEELINQIDGKE